MSNDPLTCYVSKMREVKASDQLLDAVLRRADEERRAAGDAKAEAGAGAEPTVRAGRSEAPSAAPARRRAAHPRVKRPRAFKFALAACLALLAVVAGVGLSLALPGAGASDRLLAAQGGDSPFAVKAYGAVDDTLLPSGSHGTLLFNCEDETQRMVSTDPDEYANEGFYTGCVFSVESADQDIVRVQANVSKGELYRVTSKTYSLESDPELTMEIAGWKPYKIGQGDLLGAYDRIAPVLYYGTIHEGEENVGKDRNDPSRTGKVNLYQRLGATVDTEAMNDPEASAEDYSFGLWTNEPYEAVDIYDPNKTDNPDPDTNINRALDTLDGAQLTVTVTFADGTCATQVIDLHSADFKANIVTTADGVNQVLELVPEIVEVPERTFDQALDDYNNGIASIHTLYGLVNETNDEPFPCGEASHPGLDAPLTKPRALELAPPADNEGCEAEAPQKPTINPSCLTDLADTPPYEETGMHSFVDNVSATASSVTAFERVERLSRLPEGVNLEDLTAYYPAGYESELDHVDCSFPGYDGSESASGESAQCTIASDGTVTPGYSFVLVTKQVTNTSDQRVELFVADGTLALIEQGTDAGGWHPFTRVGSPEPLWRSGHDQPGWDSHIWFQVFEPGETREVSLLYLVQVEALANPDLGFVYHEWDGIEDAKAFRIGALA